MQKLFGGDGGLEVLQQRVDGKIATLPGFQGFAAVSNMPACVSIRSHQPVKNPFADFNGDKIADHDSRNRYQDRT